MRLRADVPFSFSCWWGIDWNQIVTVYTVFHGMRTMGKAEDDRVRWEEVAKTCLLFNIRRAARAITQLYDEVGRVTGLRSTQFSLLTAIRLAAPVNLKTLGRMLSMDPTTLARNLAPLETRDFVTIEPGAHDRRERIAFPEPRRTCPRREPGEAATAGAS